MGKKGKARQDKFYHLAKETGYRSRAAFKLLQLNRKFEFLEKSRVVIDLCAAPGSWMQVAKQHMPVSSLIIGIDLFPMKPIQGCLTLQEDITTEKCYQSLKKELTTWKADVVLHDGAPNVGQNWIYDAFIQNQLVLSALKLATEFLVKGGWFVTKIFRSKDYNSLMWVLRQLFKRVHSTKPHASRMESAEIFVICQGYRAPDKLDPKFLDPKHVFQEVENISNTVMGLQAHEKSKPKAGGYEEGITSLHKSAQISDFVHKENFVDILNNATVLNMNDPEIANHPLTTIEIKECCKDIKVLGRKDLKALLGWRKAIQKSLDDKAEQLKLEENASIEKPVPMEEDACSDDEEDLSQVERQIKELEDAKVQDAKRKKKKLMNERRKLQEKMRLKMVIPGDGGPSVLEAKPLFALDQIKTDQELNQIADQEADELAEEPREKPAPFPKKAKYDKETFQLDSKGRYRREEDSDEELIFDSDDEYESDVPQDSLGLDNATDESDGESKKQPKKVRFTEAIKAATKAVAVDERKHPLLTDLEDDDSALKKKKKADKWFMKSAFQDIDDEEDEDIELDSMVREHPLQRRGAVTTEDFTDDEADEDSDEEVHVSDKAGKKPPPNKFDSDQDSDNDSSDDDDSDDSDESNLANGEDLDEGLPAAGGQVRGKKRSLTAEALALGSMIIQSRKARRDISDDGWNRYAFNDENLPDWFEADERRHSHKELPITKEVVQQYKDKMKEINVRPIKKVVEAKARKKRRTMRRMEKARKKADTISETMGMSDYDKAQQIRHIHKKAKQEKKKEVTYVVAKKHQAGKKAHRPAGVKGQFKVVDRRMKKDDKKRKATERRKGKKARTPKK
ncbi:pre-rRNA 2'-O-ribose RNA methyltransferase FTSJ3-like [Daphnia pulicaria]|uniref:pre-rRNA 2'-O-ribose RNA methyltransferase FTSJ3-like n=1 Tax=Daphnia pulicaria TaxID=35523 RepID=UPI001EEA78B3|nr:pre-rRNA 2'-O-ribose RNA methyltransferase FTSJ3-like [Daphnia pulicaria]